MLPPHIENAGLYLSSAFVTGAGFHFHDPVIVMSLQVDGFDFLVIHGLEHKPYHLDVITLELSRGIG